MRTFVDESLGPRVVFGSGTISCIADELDRLGGSRALVLCTQGRVRQAALANAVLGTRAAGLFAGAEMHTPVDVTERALSVARSVGADSVVSIGGGSTTGLGKALAARTGVPHLVIPTTYAGSEVTPVLGETADGEKVTRSAPELVPDTVVYDVELTMGLPWDVTVTSAMNAMAHAVEATSATSRTAATDRAALDSLGSLASGLRALEQDRDDVDARADLLYGAWLAGTCLARVEMGLHHRLCHTLGGTFGLPHAPTHTVVLPYVVAFNAPAAPEATADVAAALDVATAATGLQDLVRSMGGPTTLRALGFDDRDIPRAAELAASKASPNPRPVALSDLVALLTRATRGLPPC